MLGHAIDLESISSLKVNLKVFNYSFITYVITTSGSMHDVTEILIIAVKCLMVLDRPILTYQVRAQIVI